MKNFFNKIKEEKGEMSFEKQILVFIVLLFVLWVIFGGPQKSIENKSLFVPIENSR